MSLPDGVDLSKPKFDQGTYLNRAKHFFLLTNPLNLLSSGSDLDRAQRIILEYKGGKREIDGCKTLDELWDAKYLYDSAFHPDTGEKMILVGRMSAQVPMNTLITGCKLQFVAMHYVSAMCKCHVQKLLIWISVHYKQSRINRSFAYLFY